MKGYKGNEELGNALKGCEVVVIPAGVPRKPGMTRDDLFNTNATIVKNLAVAIAEYRRCVSIRLRLILLRIETAPTP